jgi:hypothetical protein
MKLSDESLWLKPIGVDFLFQTHPHPHPQDAIRSLQLVLSVCPYSYFERKRLSLLNACLFIWRVKKIKHAIEHKQNSCHSLSSRHSFAFQIDGCTHHGREATNDS